MEYNKHGITLAPGMLPFRPPGECEDEIKTFIVYGRHIFPSWPSLRLSRHPETLSPAPSSGDASSYQSKPAGSGVWESQQSFN